MKYGSHHSDPAGLFDVSPSLSFVFLALNLPKSFYPHLSSSLPATRSVRAPRSAALMPSSVRQCVSRPRPSPCTDDGALSSAICTQIEISAASHRKLRRRGRRAARQNKTEVVSPPRTMRELILFRGCPSVRHVGRRSVRTPFARLVLHSRDPTGAKRGA